MSERQLSGGQLLLDNVRGDAAHILYHVPRDTYSFYALLIKILITRDTLESWVVAL